MKSLLHILIYLLSIFSTINSEVALQLNAIKKIISSQGFDKFLDNDSTNYIGSNRHNYELCQSQMVYLTNNIKNSSLWALQSKSKIELIIMKFNTLVYKF